MNNKATAAHRAAEHIYEQEGARGVMGSTMQEMAEIIEAEFAATPDTTGETMSKPVACSNCGWRGLASDLTTETHPDHFGREHCPNCRHGDWSRIYDDDDPNYPRPDTTSEEP